eukprot:4232952-Prymnesium_polylepis.2
MAFPEAMEGSDVVTSLGHAPIALLKAALETTKARCCSLRQDHPSTKGGAFARSRNPPASTRLDTRPAVRALTVCRRPVRSVNTQVFCGDEQRPHEDSRRSA